MKTTSTLLGMLILMLSLTQSVSASSRTLSQSLKEHSFAKKRSKRGHNEMTFVIGGGTNFSFISGGGSEGVNGRPHLGLDLGGYLSLPVGKSASIQPGLRFTQKGAAFTYDIGDGTSSYRFTLHYIEIPVNLCGKAGKGLEYRGGPFLGILAGATYRATYDGESFTSGSTDGMRMVEFGLSAGIGYRAENGVGVSLDIVKGLTNIFEGDPGDSRIPTNNSIRVNLSYSISK